MSGGGGGVVASKHATKQIQESRSERVERGLNRILNSLMQANPMKLPQIVSI